ncbi:hypothetical protein NP493_174g01000 [Ridgeia piscesae]|uniref:Uncharacterized protein n=1 Tax=Ridgeia piscesae TaxID=27915 RepID=A0AAD9UFC9_RIDPI|nr:hypothetical protein NP493_174g01000 [Ridgeia piscesae]
MYLPTKMCPSRPYTESFTWWIHGRLGQGYRESYQCIPAIRWNFPCSQRRTRYGITLSTC